MKSLTEALNDGFIKFFEDYDEEEENYILPTERDVLDTVMFRLQDDYSGKKIKNATESTWGDNGGDPGEPAEYDVPDQDTFEEALEEAWLDAMCEENHLGRDSLTDEQKKEFAEICFEEISPTLAYEKFVDKLIDHAYMQEGMEDDDFDMEVSDSEYTDDDVDDWLSGKVGRFGEPVGDVELPFESLEESEEKIWGGKYVDVDGKLHKVFFKFNSSDFDEAEEEFDARIPEHYQKMNLLGKYSTEDELLRDGFISIDEPLDEALGQDYSSWKHVDSIPYNQPARNNMLPFLDVDKFIDALNSVGEDFVIRSTNLRNVSDADIKDEWMAIRRGGWSVTKDWDTSLPGFKGIYVCKKLAKNESFDDYVYQNDSSGNAQSRMADNDEEYDRWWRSYEAEREEERLTEASASKNFSAGDALGYLKNKGISNAEALVQKVCPDGEKCSQKDLDNAIGKVESLEEATATISTYNTRLKSLPKDKLQHVMDVNRKLAKNRKPVDWEPEPLEVQAEYEKRFKDQIDKHNIKRYGFTW